jgi:hypothetical protein
MRSALHAMGYGGLAADLLYGFEQFHLQNTSLQPILDPGDSNDPLT